MANYSLVVDAKFDPLSYQEMLDPVLRATQAHQQVEEAYSTIMDKADAIGALANEQADPIAYARYKRYADKLERYADRLARSGLSVSDRQGLLDMRKAYSTQIVPIGNAAERRRQLEAEQRQMRAKDNTLRFDNDFSTMSLDTILSNPNISYNSISGKEVTATTMAIAQNMAKVIENDPEYKNITGGQYWQAKQKAGYTNEEIVLAAINDPKAPKALKELKKQVHASISSNPAYDYNWAEPYINMGMYGALGTSAYSTMQNRGYETPEVKLSRASLDENKRQFNELHGVREMLDTNGKPTGIYYSPILNTYTSKDGNQIVSSPGINRGSAISVTGTDGTTHTIVDVRTSPKSAATTTKKPKPKNVEEVRPDNVDELAVTDKEKLLYGKQRGTSKNNKFDVFTWNDAHRASFDKDHKGDYYINNTGNVVGVNGAWYDDYNNNSSYHKFDNTLASFHTDYTVTDENGKKKKVARVPKGNYFMHTQASFDMIRRNIPGLASLPDEILLTQVLPKLEYHADEDWMSRNHYGVTIPGVGSNGMIIDNTKYQNFTNQMMDVIARYNTVSNLK